MEELQPEELEDLVRELEGESDAEESLPPDVQEFLRRLESDRLAIDQRDAAVRLGRVGSSSPRIVRALLAACESPSYSLGSAAAEALRSPVHQEYLQQHPDLMEEVEREPSGRRTARKAICRRWDLKKNESLSRSRARRVATSGRRQAWRWSQ